MAEVTISPWKVIEKALSIDPQRARVIVVMLAFFAFIAIASAFLATKDPKFVLWVGGVGAVAYLGLTVLANLPGLIVHVISWFLTLVFIIMSTATLARVLTEGKFLPNTTTYCLWTFLLGEGCAQEIEAETQNRLAEVNLDQISEPDGSDEDMLVAPVIEPWISISRFTPWSKDEAQAIGGALIANDWNVDTKDYLSVAAAEGTFEVRYSSPDYAVAAYRLASELQVLVAPYSSEQLSVQDLSQTRWRNDDPSHIEIWLGKK